MTRGEFLKQREEIGRIWKSQAPEGEQSNNRVSSFTQEQALLQDYYVGYSNLLVEL